LSIDRGKILLQQTRRRQLIRDEISPTRIVRFSIEECKRYHIIVFCSIRRRAVGFLFSPSRLRSRFFPAFALSPAYKSVSVSILQISKDPKLELKFRVSRALRGPEIKRTTASCIYVQRLSRSCSADRFFFSLSLFVRIPLLRSQSDFLQSPSHSPLLTVGFLSGRVCRATPRGCCCCCNHYGLSRAPPPAPSRTGNRHH